MQSPNPHDSGRPKTPDTVKLSSYHRQQPTVSLAQAEAARLAGRRIAGLCPHCRQFIILFTGPIKSSFGGLSALSIVSPALGFLALAAFVANFRVFS